ncbi:MAG: SPOR domain-containing protein [Candidatus Marithrix sp.]
MTNKRLRSNYDSAGCPPGWAWLLAGIIIGIFISFLIYLREFAPHNLPPEHAQIVPVTTPVAENKNLPPKGSDRFDFYDILPGHEIKIPSNKDDEEKPLKVTVEGRYLLQVGLFQEKTEAEGLRNYLLSLGMPTNITPAPFSVTKSGYRVQVGPFSNLEKLNNIRSLLASNNISAILLKFSGPDTQDMFGEEEKEIGLTEDDLITDDSTEWDEELDDTTDEIN